MRKSIWIVLMILFFGCGSWANQRNLDQRMFDLNQEKELAMPQAVKDLQNNRIILVGEHHNNKQHHIAQLQVIQALHNAGQKVAIGLEMFRNESQDALDRWVAGDIDEERFQEIYYDNWNFPWSAYRMIFEYARDQKIPMLGLNVPRDITRQVSQKGFQSLTSQQKGKLSDVTCRVDQEYMNYIRKAFGAHAHGQLDFTYFCEAQLVWDNAMAIHTLDYLKKNPNSIVIILTGTGHAQKGAIPRQVRARSTQPLAVILPEIPGKIDPNTISSKDADYIMLDLN
jgi:uncharacterized iron-regulated protein